MDSQVVLLIKVAFGDLEFGRFMMLVWEKGAGESFPPLLKKF